MSRDWPGDREEGDEEEDYIPPPPRAPRPAPRAAATRPAPRPAAPAPVAPRRPAPAAAPQRDSFPLVVSAVVVLLIAGLMAVFLLSNGSSPSAPAPGGANPGGVSGAAPLPTSTPAVASGDANAAPTTEQPPRMALDEFKALYDDPAKRPLILDVRAKEAFDAGHITGAISFPESDVDARVAELPKNKLIVAYCQ
jgi:rhodanese-like protein